MVSEDERQYLWDVYATHRRLRINLGIRRRLATLLNGDRRRVELLNSLLFSLNGTPIVYYGDEIGMGDNPFLGDRDGVRTPMQWSGDRNAGFSRADEVALYLPPIGDHRFGYEAANVEQQRTLRSSLLNWMRWIIRVRRAHPAFGHGDIVFLRPENGKLLAYLRRSETEVLLCVANLCETAQAAELDLSEWKGRVPVDVFGGCRFPAIGKRRYVVTLPGHEFLWLKLIPEEDLPDAECVKLEASVRPDLPAPDRPLPPRPREKESRAAPQHRQS
jgi:maltose alpha-D-glucosyltransferase/alpha-amylase